MSEASSLVFGLVSGLVSSLGVFASLLQAHSTLEIKKRDLLLPALGMFAGNIKSQHRRHWKAVLQRHCGWSFQSDVFQPLDSSSDIKTMGGSQE